MHDHQINPVPDGGLGDLGAVTAVAGVLDGELQAAFERVRQQIATGRGGGSGCGIDDQHGAHDARAYGRGDDAGRAAGEKERH